MYPYTVPPLEYAYDALEPYIDAETMHYHHDKHFQTYADKLNAALEPYPDLWNTPLAELLANPEKLPPAARTAILNNGGGFYNHDFFFKHLTPPSSDRVVVTTPEIKQALTDAAVNLFGSGWAMLAESPNGTQSVVTLKDQSTGLVAGLKPILMIDVWEHAYYLKYKNDRAGYTQNIWNVLKGG